MLRGPGGEGSYLVEIISLLMGSLLSTSLGSFSNSFGVPTEQIELSDGKTALMWETISGGGDGISQCKETLVFDTNGKVESTQTTGCGSTILPGYASKHYESAGGWTKWKSICKGGKPC